MKSIILSYLLVCAISYISLSEAQTVLKAAAPANNVRDCFCQCSSLSFRDKNNRVNGNCRTTFNGGQWCYITDEAARNGDCPDSNPSTRFPGKKWSYFSCATPSTRQCVLDAVRNGGCFPQVFDTKINVKSAFKPSKTPSSDPNSP
uniref:Uncharacterized protein n=1 Tax=Lepeophtheirus salmonis TaxID=72036 RepID=A0A0K2V166_LEPSM